MGSSYEGKVSGSIRNKRGQQGATATRIAQITEGATVDVLDVYAPEGWVFIRHEGQTGYVMERYLQDVEDAPEEPSLPSDEDWLTVRNMAAEIVRIADKKLGVE